MTKHTDLVKRLRGSHAFAPLPVLLDAADAIEELEARWRRGMTKYADLVKRLRETGGGPGFPWNALNEAADAIEELETPWQPIETAPKDGTHILLCMKGFRPESGQWAEAGDYARWVSFDPEGVFEDDAELIDYLRGGDWQPTHWMPLPNPPEER